MSDHAGPNFDKSVLGWYDAIDTRSYPGTATTWFDLSRNAKNAVLSGAFAVDSGGMKFTSGRADIVNEAFPSCTFITIEAYIRWDTANTGMFLGFNGYDVWANLGRLGYNNSASNQIGISAAQVTSLGLVGSYHHYVFVMKNSGSMMANNKIYIDGVPQTLAAQAAADGNGMTFSNTLTLCNWNAGGYPGLITYASLRVYGRELTADEAQRSFAARRGRYGL